ncbi:MAG: c-type cytochrome [Gammaproteobacteria bacterium]
MISRAGDRTGREVYNNHCYFCHGYAGDARTVASRFLQPPPRDFTALDPGEPGREDMIRAVSAGRPGSAMMGFEHVLSRGEIEAVVDFILDSFVEGRRANLRYHSAENGWPDHERYADAFPYALGTLALDAKDEDLTPAQRRGKRLFLTSCVVCHDRARLIDDRTLWDRRTVSFPRGGYSHRAEGGADAVSSATPSTPHAIAPRLADASPQQRRGEEIFQRNCAFCHARDGTGRNWIGGFLQPHPRDLTAASVAAMMPERLREVIAKGVSGSAMPAWETVLDATEIAAVAAYVEAAFIRNAADGERRDRD